MANPTLYGDISPRTAAYVAVELLKRGLPYLCLEKFGQSKPIPANNTTSIKFRRYNALALATTPLTEGVTPTAKKLTKTDVTATLSQYGDLVEITDIVYDTHEDPVLKEATAIIGEQAAQTIETIRFGVLKAGTNVFYANDDGTPLRTEVISPVSLTVQRKVTRALKRQNALPITSIVKSSANYGTESILPAYVALGHTDLEADIRGMSKFTDAKDYGSTQPMEAEIGSCESARYILSNIFTAWADAGANKGSMISTSAVKADVYPILYIARDAYGLVALKGKYAITPMVINPTPSKSDPLGQRGSVSWKTLQTAVILNDAWMARLECAATEL